MIKDHILQLQLRSLYESYQTVAISCLEDVIEYPQEKEKKKENKKIIYYLN